MIKILAIDDKNDNLISLKALILDDFPDSAFIAALAGPEGIELAIAHDPDVILLDIAMPGMDGFEVCRRLKQDKSLRDIPVVFLTAVKGDIESRVKALETGAEAFLSKPIEVSELTAQIRAMVKIKSANRLKSSEQERLAVLVSERTRELELSQMALLNLLEDLKTEIEFRKKSEEMLRASEERYKLITENMTEGVLLADMNLNVKFRTPSASKKLGYTWQELQSIPLERQLTKESFERLMKVVADELTTARLADPNIEINVIIDLEFVRKDGSTYWSEYSFKVLRDNEGRPTDILGVGRDVTDRKRSEQSLLESEQKFMAAFNANPIPVAISTIQEGRFLNVNDAFMKSFSYSSKTEIIGKTSVELGLFANPSDRQSMRKDVEETGRVNNRELKMVTKDGRVLYLLFSAEPVLISVQQCLLTSAVDITELKKAGEEKQALEERLSRAEKMEALGLLAGGVAHDLNNVLGIVVGYAELLLSEVDNESPLREDVVTIMDGGHRAAAIVEDMLALARRGVAGRKILNINKLINDFKKSPDWNKLLSYHPDVKIKTELEPDLLNISGSSVHLIKTLYNLVSNATEAMTKGGTLTIKTTNQYIDKPISGYDTIREGDYVVLSISDEGEGISETDIKRIFEPFYTKKIMGRSGTGLGLSVVWGTVKDHQGYIDVQSEEGKGTTFTLYFQITREDIAVDDIAVSLSEYMGKGQSILVVDDVKKQRDLASRMLKSLNYNVASAASGEDAVEYLRDHKIDLLVLDMIMDPGMDGLDTYKSVLKIHPKQKAIIVSGFSESDRVHDAQALGAGAYVKKPYVIEKLGMAVKKELVYK